MFKILATCVLIFFSQIGSAANILIMGDSISAGYGMELDQGWVALLQKKIASEGYEHSVVNASISGETTGGGVRRIGRELQVQQPVAVVIELGANDGLRGAAPKVIEANLGKMIEEAHRVRAKVVLLGMRIPPNYGKRYTDLFYQVYARLAKRYEVAFVPFLMDGIGIEKTLMQPDGLHPNTDAQPMMRDAVWAILKPVLSKNP